MKTLMYIIAATCLISCNKIDSRLAKEAKDLDVAIELARTEDLLEIRKATRLVVIPTLGQPIEVRSTADVKKVMSFLDVRKETPTPGVELARIEFFKNNDALRTIWVYHDGEWGVIRPGGYDYTLGRNAELMKFITNKMNSEQEDVGPDGPNP